MTPHTDTTATDSPSGPAPGERLYYRSLDQLADTPGFRETLHREFPEGATEAPDGVSRRNFLGVIAASVALAGMTSCRKPKQYIRPLNKRPEDLVPGIPQQYASAFQLGGYSFGTLVRSNDGRPTKVEGNPLHPSSLGAATQFMQADLLTLYDPARARAIQPDPATHADEITQRMHAAEEEGGHHLTRDQVAREVDGGLLELFEKWWRGPDNARLLHLLQAGGQGLHLLTPPTTSPTINHMLQLVRDNLPHARVHTWQPLNRDNELAGSRMAFGRALDTHHDFENADVVVSLDADFLGLDGDVLRNTRSWARSRKVEQRGDTMSRLYAVEPDYSVTGSMADHRFRVRAQEITEVAFALAARLGVPGSAFDSWEDHRLETPAPAGAEGQDWISVVAEDLRAARGRCAVVVGPRQPAVVHAVAHAINAALGNVGRTVHHTATDPGMAPRQSASIAALAEAMDAGDVDTLVCLGANPVYDAPADLDFAGRLAKVPTRIHLGLYRDETTAALFADGDKTNWFLPLAHGLEGWNDGHARDGTLTFGQPLIAPLHGGMTITELIALLIDHSPRDSHGILEQFWKTHAGVTDFQGWWERALHDGLVQDSAAPRVSPPPVDQQALARAVGAHQRSREGAADNVELVFAADSKLLDGRFSNNSWMQELPDPLTKITWDNAALMSRATARALGVENGDMLRIEHGGRTVEAPAWIVPGHADWSLTLPLGYGRRLDEDCRVAAGRGFDFYRLRTRDTQGFARGATVRPTGGSYEIVTTQDHGTMAGRNLVREDSIQHYNETPDPHGYVEWFAPMADEAAKVQKAKHPGKQAEEIVEELKGDRSLWDERDYDAELSPYQWGMTIDLNACTGCNACVVACVAENNIPMVGKQEVSRGREMHWLRMDRYFSEADVHDDPLTVAEEPQVAHQPVPCMQCENAPCESVCPVTATSHSPDGLNDMAYNRCIGTRYCSNNCPYKVRRFNWLDFHGRVADTKEMAFNPDVTVRSRGVMEKCTYCVQRINGAKIQSKLEGRQIEDGEIEPACAQSCPAEAITFGNILDPGSEVAKKRNSPLSYGLLNDLNTRPRTTYLARFRNPNPKLTQPS